MTVLPFQAEGLPKLEGSSVARRRALEPWLFELGEPTVIEIGGVGVVRINVDGFDAADPPPAREELVIVGADGRRGRIAIDLRLASALVCGGLGLGAPSWIRGLGVAERAILAGQVASVLARLGSFASIEVSAASPLIRPSPAAQTVAVALVVETRAAAGRVRLDLPQVWLTSSPRPDSRLRRSLLSEGLRLRTVGALELSRTNVPATDWAAVEPGDAVVFDGAAPVDLTRDWAIDFRIGQHVAGARLERGGALTIVEPFRLVPRPAVRSRTIKEASTMSPEPDDQSRALLAGAPIEVVAEVGRLSLRGEEVLRLQRGSVLPLGVRGVEVTLTAGGDVWARGELVDFDGELGVRITSLLGRAPAP
jgi:type III secretion system YscQ/HrcQ family protein